MQISSETNKHTVIATPPVFGAYDTFVFNVDDAVVFGAFDAVAFDTYDTFVDVAIKSSKRYFSISSDRSDPEMVLQ